MIIEYNSENPVVLGQTPVLLDFYATWCGPCKITKQNLQKFEESYPQVQIYTINVDEFEDVAEKHKVQSLPTLIYLNEDEELWRHNGLMTVKMLEEKING